MPNIIASFFMTGADRPLLDRAPSAIDRLYRWRRTALFISVTLGYGLFYTCRMNFSVTKKPMLDAGIMSATEMGIAGSGLLLVYSFVKLANGFLAEKREVVIPGKRSS